ncbi:putative glycoside hydrolase family 15 protein [Candidatus Bathyarchaeota archaeon]|nr:putative glycoside hydrolase family 15 protein [Candidatus Bathyarchaeota archaeon]
MVVNLKKAAIIYNRLPQPSEYEFIASHFGLLDTEFGMTASQMQSLKATNPNLKVIGYKDLVLMRDTDEDWATVNANEGWFIHDVNGVRVRWNITSYGMNPANTGWRTHFVNYINTKIVMGNYDGVFLDDVWVGCYFQNVPSTHAASWYSDILSFLQYVKANIGSNKIVMINSNEYEASDSTFINATGAGMIEGFVHRDWEATSVNRPTSLIMLQIDRLYLDSGNDKLLFCLSGARPAGTTQEDNRVLKYCYVGYLLGINGDKACWGYFVPVDGSISNWYFPLMDIDIGQPVAAYYQNQSVYMRDFTGGKVLFNPSVNSYTVNLGGNYKLLDGTVVSSIIMEPWTGEVLLTEAPPPPTPSIALPTIVALTLIGVGAIYVLSKKK